MGPVSVSSNTMGQEFKPALNTVETDVKLDNKIFPSEAPSSEIPQDTPSLLNMTTAVYNPLCTSDGSQDAPQNELYVTPERDEATSPSPPELAEVTTVTIPE